MKKSDFKLTKFDHLLHQAELIEFLSAPRDFPAFFVQNPVWLSKGAYFKQRIGDLLYIFKQTKIYNNEVFYHVGTPLHIRGDVTLESAAAKSLLENGIDCLLTDYHKDFVIGFDTRADAQPEFVYLSDDYTLLRAPEEQLLGGEWKSWRQSLRKCDKLLTVRCFHGDFSFMLPNQLNSILDKWKKYREKHIAKHNSWYKDNYPNIENCMVMVFYKEGKPISYNISQLIGDTIFFLDEKTVMGDLPNSFTLAKAYQIECFRWWLEKTGKETLWMTSGLGEKVYQLEDKTFDLDKHKELLKPHTHLRMYKVRGATH